MKNKSILHWLKSPLLYVPLIGISVYLMFFRPHSNNIISDDTNVYCSTTESEAKFRLICWASGGILVDDAAGNRFVIDKEKIQCDDSIVLKKFNPKYEYYIKMESPETLFRGKTIDEVVEKIGDYIYGGVAQGEYLFPQVVAVQGKVRHYGLTVVTGEDGKVTSAKCGEETSSNWFGALPFYSDIVNLNMFTAFSEPILQDVPEAEESKGIIGWLLHAVWNLIKFVLFILLYFVFIFIVFAIPLCIIFPILRLFTFIKSVPNWLISATVWIIGLIIVYVITIAQVEGTRSVWLITMPINLFVGLYIITIFYVAVENGRCPKCRKDNAFISKREEVAKHTYTKDGEKSSKGSKRYVGKRKGRKIYNQDIYFTATEREITITEYHVTDTCKYCGHIEEYNIKETEKGEIIETDHWTDVIVTTVKIQKNTSPTYYGDDRSVTDANGNYYDRVGDYDIGSDIIHHNGNRYKRRY